MDPAYFMNTGEVSVEDMMTEIVNEAGMKNITDLFLDMNEYCFKKCVDRYRDMQLQAYEKTCITNCIEKYFAAWQRVQVRFQEQQQAQIQASQQAAAKDAEAAAKENS